MICICLLKAKTFENASLHAKLQFTFPSKICNLGNKKAHFTRAISTKIRYKNNPINVKELKIKHYYVEGINNQPVLLLILSSDFSLVFGLASIKWVQDGGADQSSNGPRGCLCNRFKIKPHHPFISFLSNEKERIGF